MKPMVLAGLVCVFLNSAAAAQEGPTASAGDPDSHLGWFDRIVERFANELGLDDTQRTRFRELAEAQRQRMQDMSQRWREIREATRAGDEERAAALRAEMSRGANPGSVLADLLDDAEPLVRDDQLERLYEMQDRFAEQRRQREMYRRVMTDLPEELGLDETQRGQWDQFLAESREQRRARWQAMRPLWQEIREAEDAGEQERATELRKQLEGMQPDREQMLATFFEKLQTILRNEQKTILDGFRQEFGIGREREAAGGASDVRNVLRAVRRVRLSRAQRTAFKEIERDALKARRALRRRDAEAQTRLAAKVKQQILELLEPEQRRVFEEQLQRLDRRAHRSATP